MAIGDTIQAGLMRTDSSPIQIAGAAQARANQAFGNALTSVATGFLEGREKKARAEEMTGYLMNQGASESDAKAIARNPFLQKEFQRKQEADQRMAIAKLQASTSRSNVSRTLASKAKEMEAAENLRKEGEAKLAEQEQEGLDFTSSLFTEVPTGNLNETGRDEFERGYVFTGGDQEQVDNFVSQLREDPNLQETTPRMNLEGNSFLQSYSGKSPEQQQLALNYIKARQKAAPTTKDLLEIEDKIQDMDIKRSDFGDSESIKTFTPKSNYLQLGTTKMPISGRLGNEAEAIKYKDKYIPAFNQTNATFEKLLALGQKRADGWYMSEKDKDQALSYIKTLQGNIREDILGPGTVQESERVILDNIVKNPTKAFTFNGAEANMEILRNLRQTIFERLENRLGNFGLKLGDSISPNSPQAKPDYTDETSTGNKIRTFDFDNLNQ